MKCPKCESENCQYVSTTKTTRSGFDFGDACCGTILMGPIGVLCGLCGMSTETETKEYWVCHNCGQKFQGNGTKITEDASIKLIEKHEIAFVKDVLVAEALNNNSFWQKVQEGYNYYVKNTGLAARYIESDREQNNYECQTIFKKCVKYKEQDVKVYFAIIATEGLLVLEDGIFIKDMMIKKQQLNSIVSYDKNVYFNQSLFPTNSVQEAETLQQFMSFLYPEASCKKLDSQEDVFDEVQKQEGSFLDKNHYTNQDEYKTYISELKDEYIKYYLELYPHDKYEEYMEARERRKATIKKSKIVQLILAVILLLTLGIIGPLVSIGIFIVFMFVEDSMWNKKRKSLEMSRELELVEQLLDEDKEHLGKVDLEECKNSIKEMKEKIAIRDEYRD